MGGSLRHNSKHFKRLLAERHNPSPDILNKAVNLLKSERLSISGEPTENPHQTNPGKVYKVKELARDIGMAEQKVKAVFREWITKLYGIEYVNLASDFAQKILNDWLKQRRIKSVADKRKAISTLQFSGEYWDSEAGGYQTSLAGLRK